MRDHEFARIIKQIILVLKSAVMVMALLFVMVIVMVSPNLKRSILAYFDANDKPEVAQAAEIVEGIHVETGLIDSEGLQLVIANCTSCHSSKLITQNRMSRVGWESTIKWMQQTQNLWDLGDNEAPILDYLATNYAPQKKGRRAALQDIEWYALED